MRRRHPTLRFWPRLWLMTDERMGDGLWEALERLPRGSGVVFRHYGLPHVERICLMRKLAKVARRRHLLLVRAGPQRLAGEQGVHGAGRGAGLKTWAVHNSREAGRARKAGADLLFVSPVFPTRSHPGARTLGLWRFAALIRRVDVPVIALGGMNARAFRRVRPLGADGWAGIDAWTRQIRI